MVNVSNQGINAFELLLHADHQICTQLIAHGRSAETPVALIEQGTTQQQRVYTGTLASLPELLAQQQVHAPTLVIVGEVVTLREKLAWFEGAQSRE